MGLGTMLLLLENIGCDSSISKEQMITWKTEICGLLNNVVCVDTDKLDMKAGEVDVERVLKIIEHYRIKY